MSEPYDFMRDFFGAGRGREGWRAVTKSVTLTNADFNKSLRALFDNGFAAGKRVRLKLDDKVYTIRIEKVEQKP